MIFVTDRIAGSYYNYDDLNRVESNTQTLKNELLAMAYNLTLSHKTDWDTTDIPKITEMPRYLSNVNAVVTALPNTTSDLPTSMRFLDYIGANKIEENLEILYNQIENIKAAYKKSGTFKSGQEVIF